jgi:hypothetical protein
MPLTRFCARYLPRLCYCAFLLVFAGSGLAAQEHDHGDDHDHDHLHFSHPMVTESPTPDTKIRLDYVHAWTTGADELSVNETRLEGEYAFTDAVSLAVTAPFIWVSDPAGDRVSSLGNLELSLKAAKVASEEHHVLVGGGLSAGLPTGSDSKGIGSSHLVELEPFVDAAFKRNALELVGFARLSSLLRRRADDDNERELSFDFSSLYKIHPALEALLEASTSRGLVGADKGIQQTFIAPGIKLYPFTNKKLMMGASFLIGTGVVSDTKLFVISGFYHF